MNWSLSFDMGDISIITQIDDITLLQKEIDATGLKL